MTSPHSKGDTGVKMHGLQGTRRHGYALTVEARLRSQAQPAGFEVWSERGFEKVPTETLPHPRSQGCMAPQMPILC